MYEEFFGMTHTPFVRNVPVSALYETPAMKEVLGRLRYIADNKGFAVLTADAGCGKSTMIRRFADSLDPERFILIYLSDSKLTPRWLYAGMLNQLGFESFFYRGDSKRELQKRIEFIRNVAHKNVVCVLDEAHLLEKETIEEFRFLLNQDFDSTSPMSLILVGQNELWDEKLRMQRYAAVRQRVDMYCVLPHLSRAETDDYIRSHLAYAGCQGQIFTDSACEVIYTASGGIMRVINRICEKSLLYAFQRKNRLIDDHMVRYIVDHEMLGCDGVTKERTPGE